jgi:hypothetical protein
MATTSLKGGAVSGVDELEGIVIGDWKAREGRTSLTSNAVPMKTRFERWEAQTACLLHNCDIPPGNLRLFLPLYVPPS